MWLAALNMVKAAETSWPVNLLFAARVYQARA